MPLFKYCHLSVNKMSFRQSAAHKQVGRNAGTTRLPPMSCISRILRDLGIGCHGSSARRKRGCELPQPRFATAAE
jgi:hypothetical protein